ncbi:MAG: hypothetical protein SGJ21_03610 [Alphaproteobacteria bacterium]|nr:hypothetical protein [Alphaproteobacteria bacterium]
MKSFSPSKTFAMLAAAGGVSLVLSQPASAGVSITAGRSLCKAAVAEQIEPVPTSTRFIDEGLSVNSDTITLRLKLSFGERGKSAAVCVVDRATSVATVTTDLPVTTLVQR